MSPKKINESSYPSSKKPTLTHSSVNPFSRTQECSTNPKLKNNHIDEIKNNSNRTKSAGDFSSTIHSYNEQQETPKKEVKNKSFLKKLTNKIKFFSSNSTDIEEEGEEVMKVSSPTLFPSKTVCVESPIYHTKSEPLQQFEWQDPPLRAKKIKKSSHIEFHRKSVTKNEDPTGEWQAQPQKLHGNSATKVSDILGAINRDSTGEKQEQPQLREKGSNTKFNRNSDASLVCGILGAMNRNSTSEFQEQQKLRENGSNIKFHRNSATKVIDILGAINGFQDTNNSDDNFSDYYFESTLN